MENKNEQVEQVETMKTTKNLLTSSKSKGPRGALLSGVVGSFIGMGIVGFCFGIGLMGSLSNPRPPGAHASC